jgi:hypothetical protein
MPKYRVTICSGVFEIDAADEDEAIDDALAQADYEVVEVEDDEDELDDEDEEENFDDDDDE